MLLFELDSLTSLLHVAGLHAVKVLLFRVAGPDSHALLLFILLCPVEFFGHQCFRLCCAYGTELSFCIASEIFNDVLVSRITVRVLRLNVSPVFHAPFVENLILALSKLGPVVYL